MPTSDDQAERPAIALVEDPELAEIFERIARAVPGAADNGLGLALHVLLNLYARLLEEGASLSLLTCHEPVRDPEVDHG